MIREKDARFAAARFGFDVRCRENLLAFADQVADVHAGSHKDCCRLREAAQAKDADPPSWCTNEQADIFVYPPDRAAIT